MSDRILEMMPGGRISLGLDSIKEVELIELLGSGGAGDVWKAVDKKTGNKYVLKIIRFFTKPDDETIKRIELEAGVSVDSEHVIPAIGLKEFDLHTFFLLFPYFEGTALDKVLKETALSDVEKKNIYNQVLKSVDDIHRHNIIHRDLKPANFLLLADGKIKLIDFGIAKFAGKEITRSGWRGTQEYIPPESLREGSRNADARVDIYALGQILYEIVVGKHFWKKQDWYGLEDLIEFLNQDPRPTEVILLDGFECNFYANANNVLLKMVKRDPNERFSSVKEVMEALEIVDAPITIADSIISIPFLIVESGTNRNAQLPIHVASGGVNQYGRADIAGNDSSISRKHIEFSRIANKYFVKDLASKNGTLLNGNTLGSTPTEINSGDRIKLGDIFLRFEFI